MSRLVEFATNHPMLISAFISVLVALLFTVFKAATGNGLSPAASVLLLNREGAIPVDLRAEASYRAGHVINAVRVEFSQLDEGMKKLERFRDKPLLVYCESGITSGKAIAKLRAAGFPKLFELQGGIAAWRADNLPLEAGK